MQISAFHKERGNTKSYNNHLFCLSDSLAQLMEEYRQPYKDHNYRPEWKLQMPPAEIISKHYHTPGEDEQREENPANII
jgi:hypothetical protein